MRKYKLHASSLEYIGAYIETITLYIKVYCITIIHSKFQLYVICNMITLLMQQLQLIPVLVLESIRTAVTGYM